MSRFIIGVESLRSRLGPFLDEETQQRMDSLLFRFRNHSEFHAYHSVKIGLMMLNMADYLELDMAKAGLAGVLHDIGKLGTPQEILHKDDALTPQEYLEVQKHAQHSYDVMMAQGGQIAEAAEVTLGTHRYGQLHKYPDRDPKTEEDQFLGRLLSACDKIDATLNRKDKKKRNNSVLDPVTRILYGTLENSALAEEILKENLLSTGHQRIIVNSADLYR